MSQGTDIFCQWTFTDPISIYVNDALIYNLQGDSPLASYKRIFESILLLTWVSLTKACLRANFF